MSYVAGIDGGGTKTIAVIADSEGCVVAKATGGPVNPNVINKTKLFQTLSGLIDDLKKQNNAVFEQVTSLFAGISGAGNDKAVTMLTSMLRELVPDETVVRVEPDTVNALYSGTYGQPGIVQISGTGSITFGINANGRRDRVGGWGYLFGDEGSGYDIGREGIIAALKAFDGRGNNTVLLDMVRSHFRIQNPFDLIQYIYASESPKSEISPVAKLVLKAYKKEDPVAVDILANVVKELSSSIRALGTKLFQSDERVNVVLCGGVFADKAVLPKLLQEEFQGNPQLILMNPEMDPIGGSIIGALRMDNKHPNDTVIQNIMLTH